MARRTGEDEEAEPDGPSRAYARAVGQRLRLVRQQRQLTLEDVDTQSNREFKDSALSAYERGDRIISVLRLQRLAAFYRVPVDYLLPPADATEEDVIDLSSLEADRGVSTRERAAVELVRETIRLRTIAESMLDEVRRANATADSSVD